MHRSSPKVLEQEIGSRYSGHFVIGRDLDMYWVWLWCKHESELDGSDLG